MSSKDKDTPKSRNLRSSSTPTSVSSDDVSMSKIEKLMTNMISNAISQMEDKICSKLDKILTKVEEMECKLESVQVEQLRLSVELDKVKDIVVDQQRIIERFDALNRQPFLMISGVSESTIDVGDKYLENDHEKVSYICNEISTTEVDITSCVRIGKVSNRGSRLLKVGFSRISDRHTVLRQQAELRRNTDFLESFGKIFITPDSSPLARKEDKRLRDVLKDIRRSSKETDMVYIKRGHLYKNGQIMDKFDIRNQLF